MRVQVLCNLEGIAESSRIEVPVDLSRVLRVLQHSYGGPPLGAVREMPRQSELERACLAGRQGFHYSQRSHTTVLLSLLIGFPNRIGDFRGKIVFECGQRN